MLGIVYGKVRVKVRVRACCHGSKGMCLQYGTDVMMGRRLEEHVTMS